MAEDVDASRTQANMSVPDERQARRVSKVPETSGDLVPPLRTRLGEMLRQEC